MAGRKAKNQGPAIDEMIRLMGGGDGAWCTKTAGLQHARLGTLAQQPDGELTGDARTMYMSNAKLDEVGRKGTFSSSEGTQRHVPINLTLKESGHGAEFVAGTDRALDIYGSKSARSPQSLVRRRPNWKMRTGSTQRSPRESAIHSPIPPPRR